MEIAKNSRQMPSTKNLTRQKQYCDLLYAWLQCNSERVSYNSNQRRIEKGKIKWVGIERDFTRTLVDGTSQKIMSRKSIKKYFEYLEEQGLIELQPDDYYYLTVLENQEASLIEYNTLSKLMNTMQKNSINIYIYLFNRYYANDCEPFVATMRQIKEYIGVATGTTSNNAIVSDTIEILERLNLLRMKLMSDGNKTYMEFMWVKNKLD